ncbi:hypothetical protein [Lactobacillus sp. LL6]|uniref:hypothetical protein n=1 Tax=Lactobacillus sp. LL6 TaxID=2596827 RepID=UPI001186244E|nr:hypothetical protein [Lactobacillus sp. LL6]TSO26796.1 hypothetical protein FOD82_07010 [Lactobacillus sp. LL6]
MLEYLIGLESLINAGERKITVTKLCRKSNKGLNDFNYRFKTMGEFITQVLEYELNNNLRANTSEDFSRIFYNVLREIYNRKYYYHAVIGLLDTGHFEKRIEHKIKAYHKIEKIFMMEIEEYIKSTGVLRMRDVRGCASHICSRIQVWWTHEFNEDPQTIYQELRSSLDIVEKAKREKY